jgi:hypothetical protein
MQKAGVRWAGCSDGETQQLLQQQPTATNSEFIIYSGKQGGRATVLSVCVGGAGGGDVTRNRRNLQSLLSECKHLRKSSHAVFCPHPVLRLGSCQLSLQIIGHSCAYVRFS